MIFLGLIAESRAGRLRCLCDWGDRALQECNLSTQLARRLQEKQTPVPGSGAGFFLFGLPLQTRSQAKNSSFFSTQSLLLQAGQRAVPALYSVAGWAGSSVFFLVGFSGLAGVWSLRR